MQNAQLANLNLGLWGETSSISEKVEHFIIRRGRLNQLFTNPWLNKCLPPCHISPAFNHPSKEPGAIRLVVKVLPDVRWDLLPQVFQGLAFPNPLFQAVFNSTERTIFAWDLSCVDLPVLRIECDLADTRFLPTATGSHANVLQKLYKGLGQSDEVDY